VKLTDENRKALEAYVKKQRVKRTIYKGIPVLESPPSIQEQSAALLLEIWTPLAEMVEASEGITPGARNSSCGLLATKTYKEAQANHEFCKTAANNLAAIRKAVG